MSESDSWSELNRKENLRYPYSPQRDTFPKDADVYKRNIPRLLKSYACLGKKFLNDEDIEETPSLKWEEFMHPDFQWQKRNLWINNPKAVNYWLKSKGGTVRELAKFRNEEENIKTY